MSKQFLVVGSPIDHSKSPAIHRAAYGVLGLDWTYGRLEVAKGGLRQVIDNSPEDLHGFSVTMPLKEEAANNAAWLDEFATASGAANTLVRAVDGWRGYNTDVFGIVKAISALGIQQPAVVTIVGSGATAFSAVLAIKVINPLAKLNVVARNRQTRAAVLQFAKSHGLSAKAVSRVAKTFGKSELTISTLPGHAFDEQVAALKPRQLAKIRGGLLDVAYSPWPSEFAKVWSAAGGSVVSGLEMLIWQAVAQLRIFGTGNPNEELPNEVAVVEAMRHAV